MNVSNYNNRDQDLFEAIADISFIAGEMKYYSGDSRTDIFNFIFWAQQFIEENSKTDWNEVDYLSTIEEFAFQKIGSNRARHKIKIVAEILFE